MKRVISLTILTVLFAFCSSLAFGQGVYLGESSGEPETSTILETESSKGVLIPRMTHVQMIAISGPAEGLMVYNTDSSLVCYHNGTRWVGPDGESVSLEVGDSLQGGIVFYVDPTGEHGYIAGGTDLDYLGDYTRPWGCSGTLLGASSNTDGAANTATIVGGCADVGIQAKLCDDYSVVFRGVTYDDWYMPAIDQVDSMYVHRDAIGGLDFAWYPSSTESSATQFLRISFADGSTAARSKSWDYNVRPIRDF